MWFLYIPISVTFPLKALSAFGDRPPRCCHSYGTAIWSLQAPTLFFLWFTQSAWQAAHHLPEDFILSTILPPGARYHLSAKSHITSSLVIKKRLHWWSSVKSHHFKRGSHCFGPTGLGLQNPACFCKVPVMFMASKVPTLSCLHLGIYLTTGTENRSPGCSCHFVLRNTGLDTALETALAHGEYCSYVASNLYHWRHSMGQLLEDSVDTDQYAAPHYFTWELVEQTAGCCRLLSEVSFLSLLSSCGGWIRPRTAYIIGHHSLILSTNNSDNLNTYEHTHSSCYHLTFPSTTINNIHPPCLLSIQTTYCQLHLATLKKVPKKESILLAKSKSGNFRCTQSEWFLKAAQSLQWILNGRKKEVGWCWLEFTISNLLHWEHRGCIPEAETLEWRCWTEIRKSLRALGSECECE